MRVIVTLIDGNETMIEGNTDIFDHYGDWEVTHGKLGSIGFWLDDWRYAEVGTNTHKSRVFVPWCSCLMMETKEAQKPKTELLVDEGLGEQLKQQRLLSGLTMRGLAEKAGVSASHIGRIERGERSPGGRILLKIQRALR